MVFAKHPKRSVIELNGQSVPVVTAGRRSWLFMNRNPVSVYTLLTKAPRFLSWLLQTHLQPPSSKLLSVTVIPQMGCNAACGYCFQNVKVTPTSVERVGAAWMNDKIIAATVAFIEKERQRKGLDGVHLHLFGGEPLLNPERCYKLLEQIKHLVGASIVTNGVLLTPDVARGLTERGVKSVQITFDGQREDHDKVRVLAANGAGTYDTILNNLVEIDALPVLPSRQLRVNVTQDNLANLEALVRDLGSKLEPSRWTLYFAVVDDVGAGWNRALAPDQSLAEALVSLVRLAHNYGFRAPSSTSGSHCSYCSESFGEGGMVINADGQLSSCWETAGFPDMVVGNVWSGYKPQGNATKWVQCGYNSANQGPLHERSNTLEELNWTLHELAVERELRTVAS